MSAFSFTAPFISEEDEHVEREALTEEERRILSRDLYGHTSTNSSTSNTDECDDVGIHVVVPTNLDDEAIERSVELLHASISDLPSSDCYEYYEALERVPDLVRIESDPRRYLKFHKYDHFAAASSLVWYWKTRYEFFGPTHCFLPMTVRGAMSIDVPILKCGFVQLLSNDIHGRTILFVDHIRMSKPAVTREQYVRILFYFLQIVSYQSTETSSPPSNILLLNCKGYDIYKNFDRILIKKLMKLQKALPVDRKAYHMVYGNSSSVFSMAMAVYKYMAGKERRLRSVMHGGSDNAIVNELASYGIPADTVRPYINGSYRGQLTSFLNWLTNQEALEGTRIENVDELG